VDRQNPPWVAAEMAAMAAGKLQLHIFSWNKKLAKYVKVGSLRWRCSFSNKYNKKE
jgi:hypothetical protein